MPCQIVRLPSSNPAYPAIVVPEAINSERAISYAMQNRAPAHLAVTLRTRRYWFLKQSTLRELLAMPCKIVADLAATLAILVPEVINPGRAISYAMQNRTPN